MKCRGKFRFIELRKRDAGSFTNANGQVINYPASYLLKLNEKTERGIEERQFKVAEDSPLVPQIKEYNEYDEIILDFEVEMFSNSTRIVPVAIVTK